MIEDNIVFGIAPRAGKTLEYEQKLLALLVKADEVSFNSEREAHKEWWPPYCPSDFQYKPGREIYYVTFDNGIAYFLDKHQMMRMLNRYIELTGDKKNGYR